jgi:hypothetical protein
LGFIARIQHALFYIPKIQTMPKELNLTPPLVEAQKMIADFLTAQVINDSDLKRLSQLIEVGQQEIEIKRG